MKRVAVICILGIGFAWWYPWLALAGGVGVLIGWNVLEQPKAVEEFIAQVKATVF